MIVSDKELSFQTFKIILAGSHNVGKTMFAWRWKASNEEFDKGATIGADFVIKELYRGNTKYKIHMWDTAGQETYHSITAPYFRSCDGILLFFDLTDLSSFQSLPYWINLIKENSTTSPVIYLLGNKCDRSDQQVSDGDVYQFIQENNLKFFKTSAKENVNINKVVNSMLDDILSSMNMRPTYDTAVPQKIENQTDKCC